MGCVESTRRVKQIKVVQQAADDARRSSKHMNSGVPPRTPLPNLVDDEDDFDLQGLPNTDLGESSEWRPGELVRVAGSSPDSGVFELSGTEYADVVTERSPPELVSQVERDFQSPESSTELVVRGHACSRRVSNMRSEEAAILTLLRKEGLLTKERAATTGGLSYELVLTEGREEGNWLAPGARLPPIKLKQLERRRARHRRAAREQISEEQIIERLEKAEERRKGVEQEKVRRIAERVSSARPSEVRQLQQLARVQRTIEKFENTLENREHYLKNLREKLRQHHEHAAVIRLKRTLATSSGDTTRSGTPSLYDS